MFGYDEDDDKVKLFLHGEIECRNCPATGQIRVPAEVDSRDTVVASLSDMELPIGWRRICGASFDICDYYEDGIRCPACVALWEDGIRCPACVALWEEKHAAKLKEYAEKEAKRVLKAAEKEVKRVQKAVAKAAAKEAKKAEKKAEKTKEKSPKKGKKAQ